MICFLNVLLGVMVFRLPIITSFSCRASEFIHDDKKGFICDSLDIKKIKQAIDAIPLKYFNTIMSVVSQKKNPS